MINSYKLFFLNSWSIRPTIRPTIPRILGLKVFCDMLVVRSASTLRHKIWKQCHDSATGGHSGVHATVKRISQYIYWPNMHIDVRQRNRACTICQQNKSDTLPPAGLLHPLPLPHKPWQNITMDFIEGLPLSDGYNVIFVVVDRFSKYAHFMPLIHPFFVAIVARFLR